MKPKFRIITEVRESRDWKKGPLNTPMIVPVDAFSLAWMHNISVSKAVSHIEAKSLLWHFSGMQLLEQ